MAYLIHPQFVNICYTLHISCSFERLGLQEQTCFVLNQNHMEVSVRVHPTEGDVGSILKANCEIISCVTRKG